jgi:uncharacterized protein (TIGR04222 family)
MNPFDLHGPAFLFFYAVLAIVVIAVAWHVRRRNERDQNRHLGEMRRGLVLSHTHPDAAASVAFSDPYLIAHLRGGSSEVIRTAIVSLIDRGVLDVDGDKVRTSSRGREAMLRKKIEESLQARCMTARDPKDLFSNEELAAACIEYDRQLIAQRLMPNGDMNEERRRIFLPAAGVLLFISATKLLLAFLRGRTNVMFLIFFTIGSMIALYKIVFPRRTPLGDDFLAELKNLFNALKLRAAQLRPGGASAEVALLTAVFGIAALPQETFAWTKTLFPRASASSSILAHLDEIDVVEVLAEEFLDASASELRALRFLATQVPIVVHGTSLGLASTDGVDRRRLDAFARLLDALRPPIWSEHLAFVRAGDVEIGHLAAPPRNDETLDVLARNLDEVRRVIGSLPLVENVATLIDPPCSSYDEAEWLNAVLRATGANLLLDLHNLYANARNFGFDAETCVAAIPRERIGMIHMAGGRVLPGGRILDDHLHAVPDPLYELLGVVADEESIVIIERDGAYPPFGELLDEVRRARAACQPVCSNF